MKKKTSKLPEFTIPLNKNIFEAKAVPNEELRKAAAKVVKELHEDHFNPRKKMGWDVLYNHYIDEVFYTAFGHHLENYLLVELSKKKGYVIKTSDKHDGLVISRQKKGKKK